MYVMVFFLNLLARHRIIQRAHHTASGSLSESPGGVRPEYPTSGRHYVRAVSSGSRIRIRPIGGSLWKYADGCRTQTYSVSMAR